MRFWLVAVLWVLSAYGGVMQAQNPAPSEWEGEWGSFVPQESAGEWRRYLGGSLRISDCNHQACHIEALHETERGHCGGSGDLEIETGQTAAVRFRPAIKSAGQECDLGLQLSGAAGERSITVRVQGGSCGFFCTPDGTFDGAFPFKAANSFYGSDIPACFVANSPARMAICRDKSLAGVEDAAIRLASEVDGLHEPLVNQPSSIQKIIAVCDSSPYPAGCLRQQLDARITEMQKQKSEWAAETSEPGDRQQAAAKIAAIEGSYRHSFDNADVQGDNYRSTDTLQIKKASDTSISFEVHLEFFNGHECEEAGTAEYKRNGSFVLRQDEGCVFEVIPGKDGVQFADPTGKCRMLTCGARGGWNGAKFSFSERVSKPR